MWWKFIFPAIWISGFGAGTAALWLGAFHGSDNQPPPDWMRWQFLVMWLAASVWLIWSSRRLCRVSLREDTLIVSNFFREVSLPFAAISRVRQSYMSRPTTITIYLNDRTIFGKRITFMPCGPNHYLAEHPTTTELNGILARTHKDQYAIAQGVFEKYPGGTLGD